MGGVPIRLLFLNVNVMSGEKSVWLEQAAAGCDFVMCVETGRDVFPLPGFRCFDGLARGNRSLVGPGRGQGMCVWVREGIGECVTVAEADDYCLWLRVAMPNCQPFVVCCCYFPPVTSKIEWGSETQWVEAFARFRAQLLPMRSLGEVVVCGDFNAHTGCDDDTGAQAQQVLAEMGVPVGPAAGLTSVPTRFNPDDRAVCPFGQALLNTCASTGCVILNGRQVGDGALCDARHQPAPGLHPACRHTYKRGAAAAGTSVVDYCLVSPGLVPLLRGFEVGNFVHWTDHAPLKCCFVVPAAAAPSRPAAPPASPAIRWDGSAEKRQRYTELLASAPYAARRQRVLLRLQIGANLAEVCEEWCEVLLDAARSVYGVMLDGQRRLADGRPAKAWFKGCKAEHAALRAAMRVGDTHAAAVAKRAFTAARRRAKRHCERVWQARMWDALRHNPRRFWTCFRGRKRLACLVENRAEADRYWRALYGSDGQRSLPECAESAAAYASLLVNRETASGTTVLAAELNVDVSCAEVESVLSRLKPGRMAGPDGVHSELFCNAVLPPALGAQCGTHLLSADLQVLLQHAFAAGRLPPAWSSAVLCPIFKKGDPNDWDNYRGIAVGSVLGKMFSMVLERRLDGFCERSGLRARGQAGFRRHRRCSDHVFVLKHLIDSAKAAGQQLLACFVDFRKAYDMVRRDLLMQTLAGAGVHDRMLNSLVSMYWQPSLVLKLGNQQQQPFVSTRGVKQGDPLSPLLFSIFFDRVEQWFEQRMEGRDGVRLAGRLLRLLLYADDLVLLAKDRIQLQSMLGLLAEFCEEFDLEVNVEKTCVVAFGAWNSRGRRRPSVFAMKGRDGSRQQVSVVPQFRYLGVVFHESRGVEAGGDALTVAARRAMWSLLSRCANSGIDSLGMKTHLFGGMVAPILNYCSEVWSPALLSGGRGPKRLDRVMSNQQHALLFEFLRRIGGDLRQSVARVVLLREFGCRPLAHQWFMACVGMWNRVVRRRAQDPDDWLVLAMQESVAGAAGGKGWFAQFSRFARAVLGQDHALWAVDGAGVWPVVGESAASAAFHRFFFGILVSPGTNPRTAESSQVVGCTYEQWFATQRFPELDDSMPAKWRSHFHEMGGLNKACMIELVRFRVGAHNLRNVTGRWERMPRQQRICERCVDGCVEDEFHLTFECSAYDSLRELQFADLFEQFQPDEVSADSRSMAEFMNQDSRRVAAFIGACMQHRMSGGSESEEFQSVASSEVMMASDGD